MSNEQTHDVPQFPWRRQLHSPKNIEEILAFFDELIEEATRRLATSLIDRGVDPDEIDAILEQQRTDVAVWRVTAEKQVQDVIAGLRGGSA